VTEGWWGFVRDGYIQNVRIIADAQREEDAGKRNELGGFRAYNLKLTVPPKPIRT